MVELSHGPSALAEAGNQEPNRFFRDGVPLRIIGNIIVTADRGHFFSLRAMFVNFRLVAPVTVHIVLWLASRSPQRARKADRFLCAGRSTRRRIGPVKLLAE